MYGKDSEVTHAMYYVVEGLCRPFLA
uniref:PadR family transcriptional regulator n=1 Tax=Steinernema glaseri TaxID=37863 RepID=A0A1I7YUB2_9BILA